MIRKIAAWTFLMLGLLVAALLLFRTPDTDPAAMRAKYADATSQFVDLGGGLTVHVRDTGPRDAPAIVLLHGSNAFLQTWQPWADRLQRRYRVIRYDQPGHGLTGANPTGRYDTAAFVDVLERLRAKLALDRFVLAGNSMGGGVAWHYALAHRNHVRALILIDSVGQPEPGGGAAPLAFRIARVPILRDLAAMVMPRSLIADSLPGAFADPALATDAQVDRYWELLRYPGNRTATIDRFATPPDPATPAMLRRLTMPTLILWGAKDRLIPPASGQWLAAHIPNSRLILYPDTGHLPMEEAAERSAADVATFMAALPADRSAH